MSSERIHVHRPKRVVYVYQPLRPWWERAVVNGALWVHDLLPHGSLRNRIAESLVAWVVNRHDDVALVVDFQHVKGPHPQQIQQLSDYSILTLRMLSE